jgi:hypothetical protein
MTDQIARQEKRPLAWEAALPWLVAGAVGVLLILLAPNLLNDPDSYSHVALGRWIIAHHSVPAADPLSQTMRGAPWIAFEWLSQVAYAGAYALGGWIGPVTLAALAAALSFGTLTRFLQREWQPLPSLAAVLAALVLVAPHLAARPHLLAMPILVVWIGTLIQANNARRDPPLWLLPLMTLWTNLHGSFIFGLAMLGPIALEALWQAAPDARPRLLRRWIAFGGLALAAACLNPYGPAMVLVTFRTIALGQALSNITEWRPQDFSHLSSYELIVLGSFAFAVWRGITLPPLRILMLFGVLYLSLAQVRHADLLGLLAPLFLARPLALQLKGLAAQPALRGVRATLATALVLLALVGPIVARAGVVPPARNTPAAALRAIGTASAEPIFNSYDFGGYMDFVGVPPFIDGRVELYGMDYALRYDRALNLQSVPDFLALLDRYKIQTTLLAPGTPAIGLLDRLPGWKRVYSDEVAVVHRRITPIGAAPQH